MNVNYVDSLIIEILEKSDRVTIESRSPKPGYLVYNGIESAIGDTIAQALLNLQTKANNARRNRKYPI